jgi:hypothetical protein
MLVSCAPLNIHKIFRKNVKFRPHILLRCAHLINDKTFQTNFMHLSFM